MLTIAKHANISYEAFKVCYVILLGVVNVCTKHCRCVHIGTLFSWRYAKVVDIWAGGNS